MCEVRETFAKGVLGPVNMNMTDLEAQSDLCLHHVEEVSTESFSQPEDV